MASGPPFPSPYDPPPSPYGSPVPVQSPGEYPWLAPASLPPAPGFAAGFPGGGPGRAPLYELRPLSTGEVLDRTFSLYRSRFLMFAGIASLSATVQLIGQAMQLVVQHAMMRGRITDLSDLNTQLGGGLQFTNNLLGIGVAVIFLLAFAVTQAATVWAMGEVYLGHSATVSSSLRATARGWLRYLGIALWQMGSGMWMPAAVALAFLGIWAANGRRLGLGLIALLVLLLIAAAAMGFILYLRNLLAVPITVREGLGVRASMRRSKVLAAGAKGKLFLVLLMAMALYMVMAVLIGISAAILMVLHRGNILASLYPIQIVSLLLGFVGYTLVSPVVMIGNAMVYFDQRVRKEAYDVAVLLGDEAAGVPVAAATVGSGYAVGEVPGNEPRRNEPEGGAPGL